MPPTFVPSSAKRIATQMLVILKLNERKDFILIGFLCDIIHPSKNCMFKVSKWSTRIRCENFSRLRMKTLERCLWRRSSVFIVNCEHISNFVLSVDFAQANVWSVHIKKTSTFKDRIGHIISYVVAF